MQYANMTHMKWMTKSKYIVLLNTNLRNFFSVSISLLYAFPPRWECTPPSISNTDSNVKIERGVNLIVIMWQIKNSSLNTHAHHINYSFNGNYIYLSILIMSIHTNNTTIDTKTIINKVYNIIYIMHTTNRYTYFLRDLWGKPNIYSHD